MRVNNGDLVRSVRQLPQQPVPILQVQALAVSHGGEQRQGVRRVMAVAVQPRDQSLLPRKMGLAQGDVSLGDGKVPREHVAVHPRFYGAAGLGRLIWISFP